MENGIKILTITLLISCVGAFSQVTDSKHPPPQLLAQHFEITSKIIFTAVEKGIDEGDVDVFSNYFGNRVYVNLPSGESGYFSANQAYYILKNYIGVRKPLGFSFTTLGEADQIPYATGRAAFRFKGNREFTQVYVALAKSDGKWVIDKINLY
ncbi:MAG: DUF4783 domain-containing protein [Bacteroidetes bacterium]|nr:DUF4783 domain-containing protein [Bacteroidota bacterium]